MFRSSPFRFSLLKLFQAKNFMRLTCGKLLGEVKIATGTRKVLTFNGTQMRRLPSGGNLELDFSRNIEVCSFVKVSEVAFTMSRQPTRMADSKKVSGELFSLTYGALVAQIVKVDSHHLDWSMVQWLLHKYLFSYCIKVCLYFQCAVTLMNF